LIAPAITVSLFWILKLILVMVLENFIKNQRRNLIVSLYILWNYIKIDS
jgi:hypothetical protein